MIPDLIDPNTADQYILDASDIRKSFGKLEVLKGITLRVPRGEVVSLIGPSGSGKSTFLRCLNLLEFPDGGSIKLNANKLDFSTSTRRPSDRQLAEFRARTGMVFQNFNLFPHMTALGNVMEGPRTVKRMPMAQAREIALELLAKVGLSDKSDIYPDQLSGGQKQRVAIARALAMKPEAMLFDEATSALDPELVGEVLTVVRQLATEGMTMVLVTHEIPFARDVADRMVFMANGQLVEEGRPSEIVNNPTAPELRAFLSHFHGRSK
jgi:polar amino acid transport system ATP-binding protein